MQEQRDRVQRDFPRPEDPRNAPLRHQIERLVETFSVRELWQEQPGLGVSFALSNQDLGDCPTITRALPSAISEPYLNVAASVGYYLLPPDSYPRNPQIITRLGGLDIRFPRKDKPPFKVGYVGIGIHASKAVSGHKSDMIIFADALYERRFRIDQATEETRVEPLDGIGEPENIVDEITRVMQRLRQEFKETEAQRANGMLTLREQGLVAAISEKAASIHDAYVLFGTPDDQGRLRKLDVAFAPTFNTSSKSPWRDPNALDHLTFAWNYGGPQECAIRANVKRTSKNEYSRFTAEGTLRLQDQGRSGQKDIPIFFLELNPFPYTGSLDDVNEFVAQGFGSFVEHRTFGQDWKTSGNPVILATSVKL